MGILVFKSFPLHCLNRGILKVSCIIVNYRIMGLLIPLGSITHIIKFLDKKKQNAKKSKNISIKLTKCFLSNRKMIILGESKR